MHKRSARRPRNPTAYRLAALACSILILGGCAGSGGANSQRASEDPLGVLADASASSGEKERSIRALAQMAADGAIDPEVAREALKRIAWGRVNRPNVRIAAIDALVEQDPDDTARMLALMLPTESQWPVIEHVCAIATDSKAPALIPALVRSWARPVQRPSDDERPERAALLAMTDGIPVERTIFEVFATPHDPSDQFGERTRRDAWSLLTRIDPDGEAAMRYISELPPTTDDPLLSDLLLTARELGAIPLTTEQLEWVEDLRSDEHRGFWNAAKQHVAALGPEQREGFELRHIAGVLWASQRRSDWIAASRRDLLDQAETRLEGERHARRSADFPDAMVAPRETIKDWRKDLVWGDALLIGIAREAMDDPGIVREMFEQADHDKRDQSTEHGGVLDTDDQGRFIALPFPPRPAQRAGDNRFVASPELLDAGATALFHYHFHAQSHSNSDYAGPGPGDLEYAKRFGRSCIVLTFVSSDSLGVDYYQPDGARIDLGTIRRP